MKSGLFVLLVLLLFSRAPQLNAQVQSERRELAVFQLSYYGQPETNFEANVAIRGTRGSLEISVKGTGNPERNELFVRAFGRVDEQIRSAFINLGRFDVIGISKRLQYTNVDAFIEALRDYRSANAELPEAVRLGQEAFTQADFNRLSGGFIVVIPSVSFYELNRTDGGDYSARIETSFSFVNVDTLEAEEQFFIETSGFDSNPREAVAEATEGIAEQLTFRLRQMDLFRLRTGIVEIDGGDVIIEFGSNMGVRPGDEYAVVRSEVRASGFESREQTGLLVVREVQREFSIARIIYANPRPQVGDQLEEVPRFGLDATAFGQGIIDVSTADAEGELVPVFGVEGVASRGFYRFRPLLSLGLALNSDVAAFGYVPFQLLVGGEMAWYLRRIRVQPRAAVGLALGVPSREGADTVVSHVGGSIGVRLGIHVSRDILLFVEGGGIQWIGLGIPGFGGPFAQIGVTIK
jgi:hypothetical protein